MKNSELLQSTESEVKDGFIVETTKSKQDNISDEKLKVTRHKFDSLTIFEVSESELEIIEKGSPSSTYFNFSIFLLSVASSFLVTLLTNDYTNKQNTFIVFLTITILGFIIGVFLLILWLTTKNDFDQTIKKIKERVV